MVQPTPPAATPLPPTVAPLSPALPPAREYHHRAAKDTNYSNKYGADGWAYVSRVSRIPHPLHSTATTPCPTTTANPYQILSDPEDPDECTSDNAPVPQYIRLLQFANSRRALATQAATASPATKLLLALVTKRGLAKDPSCVRDTFSIANKQDTSTSLLSGYSTYLATKRNKPKSNSIQRKQDNSCVAAARNTAFKNTLDLGDLSNKPSPYQPEPPPPDKRPEVSIKKAYTMHDRDQIDASWEKERTKIFSTHNAMQLIDKADIDDDAIFVHAKLLVKQKLNKTILSRLALDGSQQPVGSYDPGDIFAACSDTTNRSFLIATSLQNAADKDMLPNLDIFDLDIPGAFLHNKLTRKMTGGRQMIARLPWDLPDPTYAGKYCEVLGAMYGLKQSNHIFDKDFELTLQKGGWLPTHSDARTFIKFDPDDDTRKCIVNMNVDDGLGISTSPKLKAELKALINDRYGEVPFQSSNGVCSVEITTNSDSSRTLSMGKYIRKLLIKAGMDKLPPALTPSLDGLFSEDPASPLLPTPRAKMFGITIGGLIYTLPIRGDIR